MIINCIAVDDEPLALNLIEEYISKIPYLNLQHKFSCAVDTLDYLKDNRTDLIFLDIQMDELSGIQLVNILKNKPMIIFTTAFDKFAVEGYDLDIVDYLLKPIGFERFFKAANRAYDKMAANESAHKNGTNISHNPDSGKFLFVKSDLKLIKINYDDILYIEGQRDYLMIHTVKDKIMTLSSFKNMETKLAGDNFCRVHKSFLVAINKISRIEKKHLIINSRTIPIGNSYASQFFSLIKKNSPSL